MNKKILSVLMLTSSISFAQVDYSQCNSALGSWGGVQIEKDGNLNTDLVGKVISKETKGNVETYVIENDASLWGDTSGKKYKKTISITKDSNGNVISLQNGPDKPSKDKLKEMKEQQLSMQLQQTVFSSNMSFGSSTNAPAFNQLEVVGPTYGVKGDNGDYKTKTLKQLTKEERKWLGIDDKLYKDLTSNVKKDRRVIKKIKNGLKKIQDKGRGFFYLGDVTDFKVENGKCSPLGKRSRNYSEVDKKVHENALISKQECLDSLRLYKKHQKNIKKCIDSEQKIFSDLMNNQKADGFGRYPGYGFNGGFGSGFGGAYSGGGYGVGMGFPGSGIGGSAGVHGQLASQKMSCEQFFGEDLTNRKAREVLEIDYSIIPSSNKE